VNSQKLNKIAWRSLFNYFSGIQPRMEN